MAKRLISLLLVLIMTISLAACGNNDTPGNTDDTNQQGSQSGTADTSNNNDKPDTNNNVELSQVLTFMGYNIPYPGDASKNPSDYGNLVGDSNYILIIEAPSIAGKVLDVTNISDAPAACEEYIAHTLEHKMRSVFDDGSTTQKITNSTEKNYNGINMLLTEGTLTNDRNGTTVEFSAIYLLAGDNGNLPVYIVGVPMNNDFNVADIVEAVAQNIKK
mgnify:CR=1 FL=1